MRRAQVAGLVPLLLAVLAGCGDEAADERAAVSTRSAPVDAISVTVSLAPLAPNGACGVPRLRRHDRSLRAVTDAMGIFRRRQHSNDAVATAEMQGLPAGDIDFEATRSPSGLGERFVLVPTHTVMQSCDADPSQQGPAGVCVVRSPAPRITSRCFAMRAVEQGRAAALSDAERVIGLAPDGIERVIVEVAGNRTETAVIENAYLARVPRRGNGTEARITLVREPRDGCEPSAAMRAAAPTLKRPPDPGGVPGSVRRSLRPNRDSPVIARHARIWGGGDGITFWIVPHLRCDVTDLETDMVCVTPVTTGSAYPAGACVEPGRTGWIHFPAGDVSAIAGFAPPHAREAVVRLEGGTVVLPVRERVFAGRLLSLPPGAEVGRAHVRYR
jgi:hypothetical protein